MGITNGTSLDAANTAFTTAVNSIFDGSPEATYTIFTDQFDADGESIEQVLLDGTPPLREWGNSGGPKQVFDLRAHGKNYPIRQFESSFSLPGTKVRGDKSGVVAHRIGQLAGSLPAKMDRLIVTQLVTNQTGYDGVSLLNDTHPNVGTGCTSDNLTTSALSFSTADTARQALEEMGDENGNFLGLTATHLLVGTAQKRVGMEITGSDRPYAVGTAGALNSGGIGAVNLPNYYHGGSLNLIVSPYLTGNEWFMFALNTPVRPYGLATFRASVIVPKDDERDDNRFFQDEYIWSVEADVIPHPGAWQCVYGSVTA